MVLELEADVLDEVGSMFEEDVVWVLLKLVEDTEIEDGEDIMEVLPIFSYICNLLPAPQFCAEFPTQTKEQSFSDWRVLPAPSILPQ